MNDESSKKPEMQFHVDEFIPKENCINTIDVIADGYCGFRVLALLLKGNENEFPSIKAAMLKELDSNAEVYHRYFNYPVDELRKIIEYGHDLVQPPSGKFSGCSSEYWFDSSICVQLACDTFRVPIAVFSDAGKCDVMTDDGIKQVPIYPPVLHVPYKGPLDKKLPPVPLIMHFVNDNHWATVAIKRSYKMIWPPIYFKHHEVCKKLGLDNNIRMYWNRHLSIAKENVVNSDSNPIVLD